MTNPPPYGYAPVAPPAPRPPLTRRQRRGALIAGAVALFLLQLGFTVAIVPVVFVGVVLLAFTITNSLASRPADASSWDRFWVDTHIDPAPWIPWLIAVAVAGILIMVLAVLVSGWILRAHGVIRPRGVTWSGIGIGIVGQWIVGGILGVIANLASLGLQQISGGIGSLGGGAAIVAIGSLVAAIPVGALTWWWMAHAFRAPAAAAAAPLGQSA